MKNIFERLISEVPENKEYLIIKNNSKHIIDSAIHLFELIEKHYGKEKTEILFKKFILSIKKKDRSKFDNKLKSLLCEKGEKR